MVPLISVIGFGKTGKTTFLANLVKALAAAGYRAAVVKHDPHDHGEVDREGSDTAVFWEAGSPAVVLSSPERLTLFRRTGEDTHPEAILPLLGQVDCVFLEGYKDWSFPKIVIWSAKAKDLSLQDGELLAVICSPAEIAEVKSRVADGIPLFSRDDIVPFARFFEKKLLQRAGSGG